MGTLILLYQSNVYEMFKPGERRFEYNVNPQGVDDVERYSKYPTNNRVQDYSANTGTPINKRPSLNYSMLDERDRNNLLHDTSYQAPLRNDERFEPRSRINSDTHIKRSTDRSANAPRNKNQYPEQSYKQTKKVYFGGEQGFKEYESGNQRVQRRTVTRDENRRFNGEDYNSYNLQENCNIGNLKGEGGKDLKARKIENKQDQLSDYGVNEKEIMEKIGRINRLNEQINNRLQRMLNKIDGA